MDQAVDIKRKWESKIIHLAGRENINIQLFTKQRLSGISGDKLEKLFIQLDGMKKDKG